jgi:hypothetical protein
MMTNLREREIRRIAQQVVKDAGFTALPVDPKQIVRSKDYLLQSWEPQELGISGFLMIKGNAVGIGYSTAIKNDGFCNFTVGHELGHLNIDGHLDALFQGGDGIHYSKSGYVSNDEHEREADAFAAELLMPEPLFLAAMRQAGSGFPAIQRLAIKGETSIVATALRFAELAEDPVAVVISSGGRVEFAKMSAALREVRGMSWIKKGDLIPRSSTTAAFNRDAAKVAAGASAEAMSPLADWCNGAPDVEMKEDVVGLGHYGKTLTVLFTNEALEQVEDDEDEDEDSYDGLPSQRWERRDRDRDY